VLYPLAKGLSATPIRVCELCEVLTVFQKTSMRKTEIEQTYRLKAAEMERDVRLKELEFKEKELSQGANQVHSSLKSIPKFLSIRL
jgi:hypothetical protein